MTKTAVVIPARGGSKGVPGKNIRYLRGKPLIAYSIEQALASPLVDVVYVSTDCEKIARVSKEFGAQVIVRPAELALDTSTSESALMHVLDSVKPQEFDYWVFLQCTSPIRHADDITKALKKIKQERADSLLSVVESHRFLWRLGLDGAESVNYDYRSRPRRQDMSLQFQENGSIYIYKPWVLRQLNNRLGGKISLYEMSPDSAVDIDTEWDFTLAEVLTQEKGR